MQLFAQTLEVINLAIEDDHVTAARRGHRLRTGLGQVDDAQTAKSECGSRAGIDPRPFVIRTAVYEPRCHSLGGRAEVLRAFLTVEGDKTSDSAHAG